MLNDKVVVVLLNFVSGLRSKTEFVKLGHSSNLVSLQQCVLLLTLGVAQWCSLPDVVNLPLTCGHQTFGIFLVNTSTIDTKEGNVFI